MEGNTLPITPIEQIYHDYHQPILRYLERLVHQHETAEDLSQETFIKALRHSEQLDQVTSVRPWLYRIATNAAYDYLRRQRRARFTAITLDEAEPVDVQAPDARWDNAEPVLAALHHLPEHYRLPLLLHEYAGYEFKDIAAALGTTVSTVKMRVHRARLHFRRTYVA